MAILQKQGGQFQIPNQPDWSDYYRKILNNPTARPEARLEAQRQLGMTSPTKATQTTQIPLAPQTTSQDPMTKFNLAILDMLQKAQSSGGNQDLYAQQRALQRAMIQRGSQITPEEQRVLSSSQQSAIRGGSMQALEPEIDAISAKIKANDSRLQNFESILGTMRELGKDLAKVTPSQEVLEGYRKMIEAGGSPNAIPEEVRDKVLPLVDWGKYTQSQKSTAGGITPTQLFDRELKLAQDFEKNAKDYRSIQRNVSNIEISYNEAIKAGLEKGSLNAASQAMITAFQKMIDPISVVRESEYARIGAGQSLWNRIAGTYEKLLYGGAGVTQKELGDFYNVSKQLLIGYQNQMLEFAKRTQNQAKSIGAKLENVLTPDVIDVLNEKETKLIRVRIKSTGQTGSLPEDEFDPNIYEKL